MGRKKIMAVFLVLGLMMTGGTVFAGDSASATLTLGSNMKCDSLTISPTTALGTVAVGDNVLDVAGSIAIGADGKVGTLTSGSSGVIYCGGNWTLASTSTFTHGSGTVQFDGSLVQLISGAATFNNLTIANTAATPSAAANVETDAVVTVADTLSITDGWFSPFTGSVFKDVSVADANGYLAPLGDLSVSGNWTNGGTFTAGTGTLTFNGTSTVTTGGAAQAFYNVVLNGTSVTLAASAAKIGGTLTLTSGFWYLDGQNLEVTGTYSCANGASLKVAGNEIVSLTMDTGSGKLVYDTPEANIAVLTNPFTTVYDVEFDDGGVDPYTFTLGANATVNGLLTVTDGTFTPSSKTLLLNGGMTVAAAGSVTGGSSTTTLADNQTVTNSSATWTAGTGTFVCDGTATFAGSEGIAFHNFTAAGAGATVTFQDAATYTVGGTLTLTGSAGNLLNIVRSASGGGQPVLKKNGASNVSHVHVNGVDGFIGKVIVAVNSWGENYSYWLFGTSSVEDGDWNNSDVWGSGHVPGESDDVTIDGNTIALNVDDVTIHSLDVTSGTFNLFKDGTGHILTVNDTVNVGGTLDVGNGGLTATGDSTVTLTGTLSIGSGTYTANGDFSASGKVTFTGAGTLNLDGNASCGALGTFTKFAGCTVDYGYAGDQSVSVVDYHHVRFSGSGAKTLCGNLTEGNDVDGNLSVAVAEVTLDVTGSNYGIDVAGNWTNNGTFSAQAGTVTFTGLADATVGPVDSSFYALVLNKAEDGATVETKLSSTGDLTVSNTLTITKGTFNLDRTTNPDYNLRLGGALVIGTNGRWLKSDQADKTVTFYGESCSFTDGSDGGPQDLGHVIVEAPAE